MSCTFAIVHDRCSVKRTIRRLPFEPMITRTTFRGLIFHNSYSDQAPMP